MNNPVELDFETGRGVTTFHSRLTYAIEAVKALPNPYVGNKRKLLFDICNTLHEKGIEYESVLDLFSGSACMSIVMKFLGKKVISNDLLLSSFEYAQAFVRNNSVDLSPEDKKFLLTHQNPDASDFVQEHYESRFTPQEAKFLDNFWANWRDDYFNVPNGYLKRSLAIANLQLYIMEHCFLGGRLNHGQILADLDHRLEHKRNKQYSKGLGFYDIYWFKFFVPENEHIHLVNNSSAIELLRLYNYDKAKVDLAYIDPPYGGEQSDYVHMYKFFEEFYLGRALKPTDDQVVFGKNFSKPKEYEKHFVSMIEQLKFVPVLAISYNDSSWAGIDKVQNILQQFRDSVELYPFHNYQYKYRNSKNKSGTEYLIIAMGSKT